MRLLSNILSYTFHHFFLAANPHYAADTAIPKDSASHAGEDVILYARGPHAHLFSGIHENAFIPHTLRCLFMSYICTYSISPQF